MANATRRMRFSVLQGVLPINPSQLPREIIAGVTLAALAIPEVMGYTKIVGTPPITGLYTLLIPAALFAFFGSSRHLVVGADSATAAILSAGLVGIASRGSDEYVALAATLALMAAALLLVARALRLGFMADFLSRTVLVGFLTGVGIQVALGQISGMLGLQRGGHGLASKVWEDLQQIASTNLYAVVISAITIAVIVGGKRFSRRIPGALIAVVGAIVVSWAAGLERHVHVLGPVPSGLPKIALPEIDLTWTLIKQLFPTAFAISVVILAQSAATSRAYATRYDEDFDEGTDLVGLTVANLGAGLSGAFVVNGSPTKTQMVDSAGGRSQVSLLVTALVVLLTLLFFTAPLAYMPTCVLSAIVFLIAIDLIDVAGMRKIYKSRKTEFWVAMITMLTVVVIGVEQGILLAVALSLIVHTRHGYRPRNAVLTPTESGDWQAHTVHKGSQAAPGLLIYRFTHSLYYANAQQLLDEVTRLVDTASPPLKWLCIDASAVDDVDYTAAETILTLNKTLDQRGIRLVVAETIEDAKSRSHRQLSEILGEKKLFTSLDEVLEEYSAS